MEGITCLLESGTTPTSEVLGSGVDTPKLLEVEGTPGLASELGLESKGRGCAGF